MRTTHQLALHFGCGHFFVLEKNALKSAANSAFEEMRVGAYAWVFLVLLSHGNLPSHCN